MYQHGKKIVFGGLPLQQATKAIVMLHGRGARPEDILSVSRVLNLNEMALVAPQATNNSWYPYSFLAPVSQNQPALDSALTLVDSAVAEIVAAGIGPEQIYFAGFSQGACLTLEYTARHAQKFGGIVAFTGGLIGSALDTSLYAGDFKNTPVFISTGNPDPHVPVERVNESADIFEKMNAQVTKVIYPGRPHTISHDEIAQANKLIFG